jgi:REP element-mobilizing transposase RayT
MLKGKSSAWIKKKNKKVPLGPFWCRGYFVSTIGITDKAITGYIKKQHNQQSAQQILL